MYPIPKCILFRNYCEECFFAACVCLFLFQTLLFVQCSQVNRKCCLESHDLVCFNHY